MPTSTGAALLSFTRARCAYLPSAHNGRNVNEHTYRFFLHPEEAWDAMYKACERATSSIVVDHFIFADDASGARFIDLFQKKAREGVRVQMVLDALGSGPLVSPVTRAALAAAGVELVFFNTFIPQRFYKITSWFFRDHHKIVVVDSTTAFTGGVCFEERMRTWRDTCVEISGPVAADLEQAFYRMWMSARGTHIRKVVRPTLRPDRPFIVLTNQPLLRRHYLSSELVRALRSAEHSVHLTTPYLAPTYGVLAALRKAARRGVAVTLLVPNSSDHPTLDLGARSYFATLLSAGVRIYRYTGPFTHTKAVTVDGRWGTLGSMNLDVASLRLNYEANIVTSDPTFIAALDAHFAKDCETATEVALASWHTRGLHEKLLEFLVRSVRMFF